MWHISIHRWKTVPVFVFSYQSGAEVFCKKRWRWPPKSFSGATSFPNYHQLYILPLFPQHCGCIYYNLVWGGGRWLTPILFTNPMWSMIWFSNCARLHNLLPIPARLLWDERLISVELCFLNKVLGLLLCLWWWQNLNILSIMDFSRIMTASVAVPTEGSGSQVEVDRSFSDKTLELGPEGWAGVWQAKRRERDTCFKQHEWQMENAIWHSKPCLEYGDQFAVLQQLSYLYRVILSLAGALCFLSYVEFDVSLTPRW